jgi:hypothetical protein
MDNRNVVNFFIILYTCKRVFWDKLGDLVVIVDCLNRPVAPRTSSGAPRAVRVNETRRPRYRISILKDAPSVDIL